jgi:hypothetical protein
VKNADSAVSFPWNKLYKNMGLLGMAAGRGSRATNVAPTTVTASATTVAAASSTEEKRSLQLSLQKFPFPQSLLL